MKREIKFRAWHTEQKRMFEVYGLGCDFVTENTFDGIDYGTNAFCGDDMNFIEIMQYTGVVNFYEGDIIEYSNRGVIGVIKFGFYECLNAADDYIYGNGFHVENLQGDFIEPLFECGFDRCIVIGNIYETPELITA